MSDRKHEDASYSPEPPKKAPEGPAPSYFPDPNPEVSTLRLDPLPSRPFIRIGNICVHIDRIVSIELLPNATIYKVGDSVMYALDAAEKMRIEGTTELEPEKVPVIVIDYVNTNDMKAFIRRWGAEAEEVWDYVTSNLASP